MTVSVASGSRQTTDHATSGRLVSEHVPKPPSAANPPDLVHTATEVTSPDQAATFASIPVGTTCQLTSVAAPEPAPGFVFGPVTFTPTEPFVVGSDGAEITIDVPVTAVPTPTPTDTVGGAGTAGMPNAGGSGFASAGMAALLIALGAAAVWVSRRRLS